MVRRIFQGLLVAAAVLAPVSGAQARSPAVDGVKAVYDFYLGGLRAGKLQVGAAFGDESYHARAKLQTTGIVGFFYDLAFDAKAAGKIDTGGLSPENYNSNSRSPKREQFVEIAFENGTPVSSRVEPPRKGKPWSIQARDQFGAIDPLSAVLAAFSPAPADTVCEQRVEVFDGRRRFALEIGKRQREKNSIRCDGAYVRLAGFKPKWMGKSASRPFTLFLEQRDDGLFEVVRAVGDTSFGAMVLKLQD